VQRILNDPNEVVDDMLKGFLRAHRDIVAPTDNPRVVRYRAAPVKGKVSDKRIYSLRMCNRTGLRPYLLLPTSPS